MLSTSHAGSLSSSGSCGWSWSYIVCMCVAQSVSICLSMFVCVFSLCRRSCVYINTTRPGRRPDGLRGEFWALESSSECWEDPSLCRQHACRYVSLSVSVFVRLSLAVSVVACLCVIISNEGSSHTNAIIYAQFDFKKKMCNVSICWETKKCPAYSTRVVP